MLGAGRKTFEERIFVKALICENLIDEIEKLMPNEGNRLDPEFIALANRIQGKVVDLVFTHGDAFEEIDNNFWLPDTLWTKVDGDPCA